MKEELYLWMKNLAVFYILFTAVLHLIPEKKYERYVRMFMGLLLILMMCMPLFSFLGKGEELAESFQDFYYGEEQKRQQKELADLQSLYLKKGYEWELGREITDHLKNKGIEVQETAVHIEGEQIFVTLYATKEWSGEQERRVADELREVWGIKEGAYQIKIEPDDRSAVAGTFASGIAPGSDGASGFP